MESKQPMATAARIALMVVVVLGAPSATFAAECRPTENHANITSGASYIQHFVEALVDADEALSKDVQKMAPTEMIVALKMAKLNFECARTRVEPFASSADQDIAMIAEGAVKTFTKFAQLQERVANYITQILDNVASGTKPRPGTDAAEASEVGAETEQAWRALLGVSIASTYVVVEEDPATGTMSGLAMTTRERDEVLRSLESTFGAQVTQGPSAGQPRLVGVAAGVYQVVADPRRTPRQKNTGQ